MIGKGGWAVLVTGGGMIEFFLALAAFLALHALPAATPLRARLIAVLGRPVYIALFSIASVLALAWLVWAALGAPYVGLWPPSPATAVVPIIAMAPACLLFAAGAARANPLSVSFIGGEPDAARPGVLAFTRHPILWAFFLWSASHAVANGDLVALVMFGGFALFSLAGMRLQERRARRRLAPETYAAAMAVARGGLRVRLARAASPRTTVELAAGVLLYVILVLLHGPVIGIDPLALL
jgi:uncharacterized membrane protein